MAAGLLLTTLCVAGGTIAWLQASTPQIRNVFTPSTIGITLTETKPEGGTAQMIPGVTLEKDPLVTVRRGSEDCWLFVRVQQEGGVVAYAGGTSATQWSDFLTYSVITGEGGWQAVPGHDGFYYRQVDADSAQNQPFPVIWFDENGNGAMEEGEQNRIGVAPTVTKEMMDALYGNPDQYPKLSFLAAAVQRESIPTVDAAWDTLPEEFTNP